MQSGQHFLSVDKFAVLCTGVACLINYNTLYAGFTYDDSRAILSNADVLPSTPLIHLWTNDFWGTALNSSNSHGSYRPISVITFRLNYWISAFKPWSYHVVNVILHSLSTYLVLVLGKIILPHPVQITAALLFAVHPVHCEAVASIVGRADILANIFFILSLLSYIAHVKLRNRNSRRTMTTTLATTETTATGTAAAEQEARKKHIFNGNSGKICKYSFYNECDLKTCRVSFVSRSLCQLLKINIYVGGLENISKNFTRLYAFTEWFSLLVTVVFAALAMFSKETGLTVLAVCAIYDVVRTTNSASKKSLLYRSLIVLALAAIGLLLVRIHVTGNCMIPTFASSDNPTSKNKSLLTRTLTFLYLPVFNFLLLVYPIQLSFDWSMDAIPRITSFSDPRNALTFVFYTSAYNFAKSCYLFTLCSNAEQPRVVATKLNDACWIRRLRQCVVSGNAGVAAGPRTDFGGNGLSQNPLCNSRVQKHHQQLWRWRRQSKCNCRYAKKPTRSRQLYAIYSISLSLLVLPFIPATNLFFYVGFVVAERVLYIPSVGYCFFVAVGHEILEKRTNVKHFRVLISVLIVMLGARTVLRNRDWYDEESLYRSGVEINPAKAYANLGSILSSQGQVEEAEHCLKTALRYRSNMADVYYNLGILQQGKAEYKEAINSYRMAILYRPSLALAHLNLGQLLISQGHCEEAEEILSRCSKLGSSNVKDPKLHESTRISALIHLGRLKADRGKYKDAVSIYEEAVQSLPETYQPQVLYNLMGEALTHINKVEEAEKWHKAAIHAKPDHIPTHLIYGKLLAKNKTRVTEAEEKFLKAQTLAPADPAVHQHFGQFLLQTKRYVEAANQYLEALKLVPTEYKFAVGAATAFRQAGHNQKAEELYREVVALKPNESGTHINLGAMLHMNGKFNEAAKYYQSAFRLNPNDHNALHNLNKLRTLMRKTKT